MEMENKEWQLLRLKNILKNSSIRKNIHHAKNCGKMQFYLLNFLAGFLSGGVIKTLPEIASKFLFKV